MSKQVQVEILHGPIKYGPRSYYTGETLAMDERTAESLANREEPDRPRVKILKSVKG